MLKARLVNSVLSAAHPIFFSTARHHHPLLHHGSIPFNMHRHPRMAFSCSRPLHYARFPSASTPNGFGAHSLPHSCDLSFPELSTLSLAKSHACNVAAQTRQRTLIHERETGNISMHRKVGSQVSLSRSVEKSAGRGSGSFVSDEKMVENRGRTTQKSDVRSRDFRGFRDKVASRSSSLRSRDGGAERKPKETEKTGKSDGRVEGKMVKRSKKAKYNTREAEMRVALDTCSKMGDVMGAIVLYDSAVRDGVRLEQYHYNVLLYLCSSAAIGVVHPAKSGTGLSSSINSLSTDKKDTSSESSPMHLDDSDAIGAENSTDIISRYDSMKEINGCGDRLDHGIPLRVSDDARNYARKRGFEIYEKMCLERIPMSEAALTSVARMAMSTGDGDMAFEIVKRMKVLGVTPRLRSYGPALFAYCDGGAVDKAFEVEAHMLASGVCPEEPELEALLKASVRARRGDKVYYLLHKLRTSVRQVSPSTANVIEEWFRSSIASRVGKRKWDEKTVAQAMENGGGGWHGLGWLGKGKWNVECTSVDADGVCVSCGEKLVTIDLDPIETKNFAKSVASIACKRERNLSFQKFQKWLDYYGPFEAVVDAANVGLFSQRRFSLTKVNAVVNGIRQKLPSKKWPLIIVHNKRIFGGKLDERINGKLIEKWRNANAIYATPTGSNDDWYWLYAAIKCKALIVTNDEMRDHIFQILGNDFFPRWKERHQVHFSFHDGNFEFHMPPPYSVVIQESVKGHWHIPTLSEHESRSKRTWLCVTRLTLETAIKETSTPPKEADPKKMVNSAASNVGGSNKTMIFTGDSYQQQCQPLAEHTQEKSTCTQRNTTIGEFPDIHSIIIDVEASERLSHCVIDFQI